jgi:ribosomal protein S27E
MKTEIECPNCKSTRVRYSHKTVQIAFGVGMFIIGLGFLITALTHAVGYYMFALPLCAVGSIRAYRGYYSPALKSHCKDCKHEFEYYLN